MSNGFLPISKQDMIDEGIEQLDFVYVCGDAYVDLSLIHISEPTRPLYISYAVFCLKTTL